ncbi:MAG TPA: hypothetical protein VN764_02190 [Polyangiaceae bacterium]|nr:hypothetical protein [Polyangiaceae bacterium]
MKPKSPIRDQGSGISTQQKALEINLDASKYGTFVEIGAGQEVARRFFTAGAAAGTVAKTMSAYDMTVSDEIYGKASAYVSRERLEQMLTHEFNLLLERLAERKPKTTEFFSYAATVTARSFQQRNECHGWIGVRLQLYPQAPPSELVLHVRMLDDDNASQADALGILGVNLLYGACYYKNKPHKIVETLLDNLEGDRVEVDFIHFAGPYFDEVDNRLMNLHLVRAWCCRAVMFDASGASVVPSSALRKKDLVVMRGSFKPPTKIHLDMSHAARELCERLGGGRERGVLSIAEITMSELGADGNVDDASFLARVDLLSQLGFNVLISDYLRFFRLRSWIRNFTQHPLNITLSVRDLDNIFDEKYYEGLEGGILVALGQLFSDDTTVFVYPAEINGHIVTLENVQVPDKVKHLLKHLVSNGALIPIEKYNAENLHITPGSLAKEMAQGRGTWEEHLPDGVAAQIIDKKLFGFPG